MKLMIAVLAFLFAAQAWGDAMFRNEGRVMVVDPKAGEFVSVFPGVHGIIFTDPATGKTATQMGIQVH